MAFCPHCGKSVTEQATKCAACGGELESRGKPARFKGTMMMSPGTAPLIQPPNAGQRSTAPAPQPASGPAPSAAASPSPIAATLPMPAVGPIADAAAAAMAGKKPAALKATMLGTGEAGLAGIAKNLQAQAVHAQAPAQPASAAAPAPLPAAPAAAPVAAAPQPAATTRREVQQADEDDSKRFLVGDPMAPKGGEAAPAQKPQRNVPRFSDEMSTELPKDRSATFIVVGIIGVCVIAAVGYAAAKLMGLAN